MKIQQLINKCRNFVIYGLYVWFCYSFYDVAMDKTFSVELKILGEIINLLSLTSLASTITKETKNLLFLAVNMILVGWYMHFLPEDLFNSGYNLIQVCVFVSIDLLMLVYSAYCVIAWMLIMSNRYQGQGHH